MTQKQKNIRLLATWIVLLVVTVSIYLLDSSQDRLTVSRDLFAMNDPSGINKVVLSSPKERNVLVFGGNQWQLNGRYTADPQRVTVLFAILKQNKVRRMVARNKEDEIDSLMQAAGVNVKFLQGENVLKQFDVVSSKDGSLTYFSQGKERYVVEIPGYRVNLGGIFSLDQNGWRNPLVFDVSWSNLQEVKVIYPQEEQNSFDIVYDNHYYAIQQLSRTDSVKLTDFLDDVSLLLVEDYLRSEELEGNVSGLPLATLLVNTLGDITHSVEFLRGGTNDDKIIGRIDSLDYALFDYESVRKLLRPKRYFMPEE
ncbi:DUF4340 domain-containing protein [Fulvivirga sp. M361]|uniref:DUF4340 domain-containing protein n=1 Tax=Fulvivirga sp. M361 TaxID=2594266 RepID=UPI00117A10B8|nr:DUF4340 domain-containing protein [Fulvivirga sp. M361]TRX52003.1 DUF4340 domain-containing protein [Fulvivirga sp. M361]